MASKNPVQRALPEVSFSDYGDVRTLHLGSEWVQGTMRMDDPYAIDLEYVQRMMAWLLFVQPDSVRKRHAMQLGLGSGALTKFCRKRLLMHTTAVEINPQVLVACRTWFKLPPEDGKLRIVLADAGAEIKQPQWHGAVDALQVDMYDDDAAAPVFDSEEFYADCKALLSEDGCMTVNLFGRTSSFSRSVERMSAVFGADAIWTFKPTREGNTIVLAQAQASRPKTALLRERAEAITTLWQLPASKWLKVLKPITD